MVIKRKAPAMRKRTYKRRRMMTRTVPRFTRPKMGEVLIKRTIARELWAFNGASVGDFWRYYSATLGQIPSLSEISNLFDSVKVCALKYTFLPRFSEYSVNSVGPPSLGQGFAHVIIDPYSNVTPSGVYGRSLCNTFLENGSVKSYPFNRKFSVYIAKPTQPQDNDSSANGRYEVARWVNPQTAAANPYRGFHIFLQDSNFVGATGPQWDVFVTYYMKCRGLR